MFMKWDKSNIYNAGRFFGQASLTGTITGVIGHTLFPQSIFANLSIREIAVSYTIGGLILSMPRVFLNHLAYYTPKNNPKSLLILLLGLNLGTLLSAGAIGKMTIDELADMKVMKAALILIAFFMVNRAMFKAIDSGEHLAALDGLIRMHPEYREEIIRVFLNEQPLLDQEDLVGCNSTAPAA